MKIEGLSDKKAKKDDFVGKNFLLISLDEKKTKKIADAINSDTSRKILDALAKKDFTESELSIELGIPISTVHYNLKQLTEANLVVVEEFHYSKKGKEVNHYSLANKYIIIAPKNDQSNFLDALKKVFPILVITAIVGLFMRMFESLKAGNVYDTAPAMMAKTEGMAMAADIARPAMQSNITAYFLFGMLAVVVIYFFYEFVKRKD